MSRDIDDKFDGIPDEPTPPPAPSRPANETRILGLPGDAWAQGINEKIDILFTAQREDTKVLEAKVDSNQRQTNENFERLFEMLAAIERHERSLQDHQRQLNEQEQARFKLEDRVAVLERDFEKRKQAAKRQKRK